MYVRVVRSLRTSAVALVLGVGTAALISSAPAAPTATKCTIKGTAGADTLRGTNRRDVICGLGGQDQIRGRGGHDLLRGGGGGDQIRAQSGDDQLVGGGGADELYGEAGNDRLDGGAGADLLDGGDGSNQCPRTEAGDLVFTTCWMGYRIVSVSITPASIDTFTADKQVQMAIEITDTRVGPGVLTSVGVDTSPPLPDPASPVGANQLRLVEGTPAHGIWAGPVSFARYASTGAHSISLLLEEEMPLPNHPGTLSIPLHVSQEDLRAAQLPHTVNQTGRGDTGAPQLVDFSISPETMQSEDGSRYIELSARVTDDLSGADWVDVRFPADDSSITLNLSDGSRTDGIWTFTYFMPPGTPPGAYSVARIRLDDRFYDRSYSTADLQAMGFPTSTHHPGDNSG